MADEIKLTMKQQLFVNHYLSNGYNGNQAAIAAGYSKGCSRQLAAETLAKPYVRTFMEQTMKEMMDKAGAGVQWRIEMLKLAADKAVTGQTNKDGVVDVDGILRPIQELNKMQGSYAPTQNNLTAVVADGSAKIDEIMQAQKEDISKYIKEQ